MKGIDKERGKHSPEGGSRWSLPSFVETMVAASPTSSSLSTWVMQQTVVVVVVDVGDVASHCLSLSLTWVTQAERFAAAEDLAVAFLTDLGGGAIATPLLIRIFSVLHKINK